MKNQKIEGIGSIGGGEIDTLTIEGIGKLKKKATINNLDIEGLFKCKATIDVDKLKIEGAARVFRDIKAKHVVIDGILKLRRAKIKSQKIICDGIIVCNKEISADEIHIDGVCSVANMYGDKITIKNKKSGLQQSKIPTSIMPLVNLYFGRKLSLNYSPVDTIECTSLTASGLKSNIIRAHDVSLSENCIVNKLYCDGDINIDDSCKVGKIISKNTSLINKKEIDDMANASLTKILDMYKDSTINADEAEKMINSLSQLKPQNIPPKNNESKSLLWEDDGKLRIVAYIGRKLLKKGEDDAKSIEVAYDGEALDVESYGNLTCNDIGNNASAGGNINSQNIDGDVTCGGNITCNNIDGNITAGGGVKIQK